MKPWRLFTRCPRCHAMLCMVWWRGQEKTAPWTEHGSIL